MNQDQLSHFRSKNRFLAQSAAALLEPEQPMTLRQLYYRLISAGVLHNAQKEYNRLKAVMTRLREEQIVPRAWLVDHVRSTLKPSSWSGLASFADAVRDGYRKSFWASLPDHVEVLVEKDAVAGTLQPITEEYDISLRICRGYSSVSFASEIADLWRRVRKPIHAYYTGDFDPSGFDIERDLREKLECYSGRTAVAEDEQPDAHSFRWKRLAVRAEDFEAHNLIRLPVKAKDRRSPGFIRAHGRSCSEVDALAPSELRRRLEEAIRSHIDLNHWARLEQTERLERQTLEQVIKGLDAAG
jgi:hypothetical protein